MLMRAGAAGYWEMFPVWDCFYIGPFLLEQTPTSLRLALAYARAARFYICRTFNSAVPELFCCCLSLYAPPLSILYILDLNVTPPGKGGAALNYGALATYAVSFP